MNKRSLTTVLGMAMALLALPGFAADINCENVAPSAGLAPADLLAACGGTGVASTQRLDPSDLAMSPDGVLTQCSSMALNAPAGVADFGFVPFQPACDFAGGDFTQLYCLNFDDFPAVLSTVNSATCDQTVIGTTSLTQTPSGMAWDDSTGTMYVSTTDVATSQLWTIDLGSGATTFVGDMGGASPGNIAIAVDSTGGAGLMYGFDIVNDSLQSIDKNTGVATTIGALGFDANFAQGMDFDESDGTCYIFAFNNAAFLAELRTCDTATGSTTLIGAIGNGFDLREWTGPGIMAGGTGCNLNAEIPREIAAGDELAVNLSITHRSPNKVNVPFVLEVRDRRGKVVASDQTERISLEYGQSVEIRRSMLLGSKIRRGNYELVVSMSNMRDGKELVSVPFVVR